MRNVVVEAPAPQRGGRPNLEREAHASSFATPATFMCLCIPLGKAVVLIAILTLFIAAHHIWFLTVLSMSSDPVLWLSCAALGLLELVGTQNPLLEVIGFYIMLLLCIVSVINLFIVLP